MTEQEQAAVRERRRAASGRDTLTVLASVKAARADVWGRCQVVGRWVWVSFASMPDVATREFLKDEGFHWNHARGVWQHSCGHWAHHAVGDPQDRYGILGAAEIESDNVAVPA